MEGLVHYIMAPIHYAWQIISITSQANSQLSRVQPLINFLSHICCVFVFVNLAIQGREREGWREGGREGGGEGEGEGRERGEKVEVREGQRGMREGWRQREGGTLEHQTGLHEHNFWKLHKNKLHANCSIALLTCC